MKRYVHWMHAVSMKWAEDWALSLSLAAMSAAYLWPFRNTLTFIDRDEGIILQGATRILAGQLPYRDFFSFYTPGSYYWNAFLLAFFGDSVLVPRTALVMYGALFSALTFLLARHLEASRKAAALAAVLLLVCALPARFVVIHSWDTTLAALLALGSAVCFLHAPGHFRSCLVGFFTALAILFNQARGMGLLLGFAIGFLALKFRMTEERLKSRFFISMSVALLLPLAVTVAFFALQGGLKAMGSGLLWPLRHYSVANHVPYGYMTMSRSSWVELFHDPSMGERALHFFILSPIFVICALPAIVVLVALWCTISPRFDLKQGHVSVAILCGAVVLGSLLSTVVARADFLHITFLAPLFFFLLPWVFTAWLAPFHSLRKAVPLVVVYALVGFSAYGLALMWGQRESSAWVETRRGTIRTLAPHETISFIQANFPPGAKLLVHPYLPLYSFLTRTTSPLTYDYLQPGMHSQTQFEEAALHLSQLKPKAVIFEPNFIDRISSSWPNTPLSAIAHDPVADYIVHNYKMCKLLEADADNGVFFLYMVRKDLTCTTRGNATAGNRPASASPD